MIRMTITILFVALVVPSGNLAIGALGDVFPGKTWVQATPKSQDVDPGKLAEAVKYLEQHAGANGTRPDGTRFWPHAPEGTFCCSGYNNNDLFVIPAWNMVTVRLGLDQGEDEITRAEYDELLRLLGQAVFDPVVEGGKHVWQSLSISFRGPRAETAASNPNPFLDYRLQVRFVGPSKQTYNVPGFFDGDGCGGSSGRLWRVRFSPDESGRWTYKASFRGGPRVAVALDPLAGQAVGFDAAEGVFHVGARDPESSDFLRWGRLLYAGRHYLKFQDGPYWIRGGTDSPENFLAYAGFDHTIASHQYADHLEDWRPGDPDWNDGRGRAIIGALNYLASKHVNSLYFLTMNIGGDGCDVWPWSGSPNPKGNPDNDNLHFDIGKLRQWEVVFQHAQQRGIFLHFVLNEAEAANKRELDNGELGTERKLYYRELIARFGHHPVLQWNLCEEYNLQFDFGPQRIREFADYVQAVDPYKHPITVHSAGNPLKALQFTFGDERFSMTSVQLGQAEIARLTEQLRKATADAGRPLPVSMDEFTLDAGQKQGWMPVNNAQRWRKEKLWPTYLSGGNIEFILGGLLATDSFKSPELDKLWDAVWYARRFLEQLPFWEMEPSDGLVTGAASITVTQNRGRNKYQIGAQVFFKPGQVYAIYFPTAKTTGQIDLSDAKGRMTLRWYDPRNGQFEGKVVTITAGRKISIGQPPSDVDKDWVVLIQRRSS